MITEARQRAGGLKLPVEFRLGDVYHLDLADHTFDGCRAERLFVHLERPDAALAEMCRVTRPGGRIVVAEPDFETRILDAPDRGLMRRILNHLCDSFANGGMGHRLPRLFRQAGLMDVSVSAVTVIKTSMAEGLSGVSFEELAGRAEAAGVVSAAEAETWLAQLREADHAGHFFNAVTAFVVSSRNP
jgi:SAM-dependent methyltransferase